MSLILFDYPLGIIFVFKKEEGAKVEKGNIREEGKGRGRGGFGFSFTL